MHVIEQRDQEDRMWVLVCSCGKRFEHRDAVGAERLFDYHAGLENARLALRGGRA